MVTVLKRGSDSKKIDEIIRKIATLKTSKGIDAKKYCGIISLVEKPLAIQKKMRDDWE